MGEKRWKIRKPSSDNKPKSVAIEKIQKVTTRLSMSDRDDKMFSEVLSNINDIRGVEPYKSIMSVNEDECQSVFRRRVRPSSSPPVLSKKNLEVWEVGTSKWKDASKQRNRTTPASEKCRKSKSS